MCRKSANREGLMWLSSAKLGGCVLQSSVQCESSRGVCHEVVTSTVQDYQPSAQEYHMFCLQLSGQCHFTTSRTIKTSLHTFSFSTFCYMKAYPAGILFED